jgi:hypothetical protein
MGRLRGVVVVVMVVMILGGVEVMLVGVVPLRKRGGQFFSFFALSSNLRLSLRLYANLRKSRREMSQLQLQDLDI